MEEHARVVIIGAGIVGCSTAYHLAELGWRDIVVLDQGPLGQNWGSTSHAPGLMFQHNVSRTVTQLAMWSADLYSRVQPPDGAAFSRVGSLEIASTPERWAELKRRVGQAASWGLDATLIGPEEAGQLIPLLRSDDLFGAFHVPGDCVVKASAIAERLAASAATRGATFHGHTPVTGIEVVNGRVRAVVTPHGRIRTEIVVAAAGIWGPLIGRMAGVPIPLTPMQHIFARTAPLPDLAGEKVEVRHPILRHQDKDLYFRQYGNAYGFGSPHEAGLSFAVDQAKGDFLGRAALDRRTAAGPARKLCCLTLDDPRVVVMGKEPILPLYGGPALGYVTSATYGYTVRRSIAYGYLPADYAAVGTRVAIQFFGERYPATVVREPLHRTRNG